MYYIVYIISYLVVFFVLVNAAKELRNLHQNSFTIVINLHTHFNEKVSFGLEKMFTSASQLGIWPEDVWFLQF